jgi:malate dehydrogenase (quinone)
MSAPDDEAAAGGCDVLLVGAGIMSATVALLLKELDPALRVAVYERADRVAAESSDARNNAGTGHSALCELNYTPEGPDGAVDVRKAVKIMECFETSKQLWAWLVARGCFGDPGEFIRSVPHLSFVRGDADCDYLLRRFAALQSCPLFYGMRYSEAPEDLAAWMPLVMAGRDPAERVAATYSGLGTDVDFGALTRGIFAYLARAHGVRVHLDCEVKSLAQGADKRWAVEVHDEIVDERRTVRAGFVFIGAGGGALDLLNESDIPEGDGYGGFPVSGQWLVCKNPEVVARHHAKVYGKAAVGAPPMSVPHLDSRVIDGRRELMFGPFAGFSTRFLKEGSYLDLPLSLTPDNLLPMLGAGIRNVPLTAYLVGQVLMGFDEKMGALREFVLDASADDWELTVAGQRVQVIKKDAEHGGRLEFGTEIISARDNTLAALLGASPGASTSVSIALDLLVDCFPEGMATAAWQAKLREMIPSYGRHLSVEPEFAKELRARTHATLGLRR